MKIIITALFLAAAVGPAATAQTAAPSTTISAADMRTIGKCKAMKHDAMARSAMCTKMVELYPNQFANTAGSNG